MTHKVIEFVNGMQPCICDCDLVLETIAGKTGIPLAVLHKQAGPTISSVLVWDIRDETKVAVYHDMRSLLDML
jgi:hypothetical protein